MTHRVRVSLFLCQKDESVLLEAWVRHALRIAEPKDVCIVDDESHDQNVLRTLRIAERRGVCVKRMPAKECAFPRKHLLFRDWVLEHGKRLMHDEGDGFTPQTLYFPQDCDEFLCARRPGDGKLCIDRECILQALEARVFCKHSVVEGRGESGEVRGASGFAHIRRWRNLSYEPGTFGQTSQHRLCMRCNKLVIVGHEILEQTGVQIDSRGYHTLQVDSSANSDVALTPLGDWDTVVYLELHNLPYELRVEKSRHMKRVLEASRQDRHSIKKYSIEAEETQAHYEKRQDVHTPLKSRQHIPHALVALGCSAVLPTRQWMEQFKVVSTRIKGAHKLFSRPYVLEEAMKAACEHIGLVYELERCGHVSKSVHLPCANIMSKPDSPQCVLVICIYNQTVKRDAALSRALSACPHMTVNAGVTDISKQRVNEAMQTIFGYNATVDPATHKGPMWQKSKLNSQKHDQGRILQGPLVIDQVQNQRYVYQRVLGKRDATKGTIEEYCLYVAFGTLILVRFTFKPLSHLRSSFNEGSNLTHEQVPVRSLFVTDSEYANLHRLIKHFGIEFGRLDIMVDDEDRPHILDVNDTPTVGVHARSMLPQLKMACLYKLSQQLSKAVDTQRE